MNTRRTIPALLVSAALAALAAPAFAAESGNDLVAVAETGSDSPIIVTEGRATEDQLITRGVVDALSSDPRLAGRIGVETIDGVVSLTGIVTSAGQSRQAIRDAKGVAGVRNVHNELSTRIGGY